MEISGKILREVEFRDRLRGYDTDEVDDFLEKVAVGVDELHVEIQMAAERAQRLERQMEDVSLPDDDSLRRTLVLAQRTADLAISEARTEGEHIVEEAQRQATELMAEATDSVRRMRTEAEEDLQDRVISLTEQRDRLEREVRALGTLLDGERERLSQLLGSLMTYVGEHLVVSDDVRSAARPLSEPILAEPASDPDLDFVADPSNEELNFSISLPDVEREIAEDAELARNGDGSPPPQPARDPDSDEELWDRWARSGENDIGTEGTEERFRFGRRPGDDWTA